MRKVLFAAFAVSLLLSVAVFAAEDLDLTSSSETGTATLAEAAENYEEFEYIVTDGEVTITGFSGDQDVVIIPSSLDGFPVTSIGEDAFEDCTALTAITIPESVQSIGDDAFEGCKGLVRVDISSLEKWCSIDFEYTYANPLYYAKSLYLNGVLITDLVIPDGITSIGRYAFSGYSGLISVTLPKSVTSIGEYAFYNCKNLTAATISDGVTNINERTFCGCSSLVSVTLPEKVTDIGESAFESCRSLASITIPNGVISIGQRAFDNCTSLTCIAIPDSVTNIGYAAFRDCVGVLSITIGKNIESIGESAFDGCSLVTSLTIPENVTTIGKGAFCGFNSLTEIKWNAKSVANFSNDNNVFLNAGQYGNGIEVVFGDTVENIPACVFFPSTYYPSPNSSGPLVPKIVSITIGKNVSSIGYSAFKRCDALTRVIMGEKVSSIGNSAFTECSSLTEIDLPDSLVSIGSGAFYDCTSLESITIPENVTEIKGSAFFNCKNLTQINWNAKNVTEFDDDNRVFSKAGQNSDGVDVVFGNKVESIPAYILCPNKSQSDQDPKVVSVTIGENVKSIGAYAFEDCFITSITIPESVETIGIGAFFHCTSLRRINWNAKNVADFDSSSTFANSGQNGGSIEVVFGDTVERIPACAFGSSSNNILSVIIGKNVKSIGEYAFNNCRYLTSLTMGESVESIGEYAFYNCSVLTSITVPENVVNIGNYAFNGCLELAEVNWNAKNVADFSSSNYIFSGAGQHGDGVFIVFGEKVESIPAYAFCPDRNVLGYPLKIVSATIGNNVKTIGEDVFCNCKNLVIFCEEDTAAYDYAIANGFEYVTGSYIVMYNANGGDGVPENQLKIRDTDLVLDSYVPSREGYSFEGWATSPGGKAEYEAGATYTPNSSVTLFAAWKANEYTVAYDANGGEGAPESQIKIHGKILYLSRTKPTREGYTFKGWSKTKDGNTIASQYRDNKSVTLYAIWELTEYSVLYDANYGTGAPKSQKKVHGEDLILSETVPTRTGYVFMGWSAKGNKHVDYLPGDTYTENCAVVLLAVWKAEEYKVTYDANGGEGAPEDQIKVYGDYLFLSRIKPTREGYIFWGWSTREDGIPEYSPGDMYTNNKELTLYAVWGSKVYFVIYDAAGGENAPEMQSKVHGNEITLCSETPTKNEYAFLGWSKSPDATEPEYKAGSTYTDDKDAELYAVWAEAVASTKVKFTTTSVTMAVGGADLQLAVTLTPANSTDTLTWSVDKLDIATVDENGVVTAHSAGKAKVTVMTESGKKATCTVTVGMPATKVEFSSLKSTSLAVGKTLTLKAKASREDKVRPVSTNVVYEIISGEEYATIDTKGKLKGVAAGEVVVRARAEAGTEDAFAEVTINVCVPITKVKLNVTKASMVVGGDDLQLVAIPYPEHHTDTLTWSVDKSNIATVDENGVVTAHTAGKVKVTVMSGSGKKATCSITIGEPATRVEFTSLKNTSLAVGKTLTLKAKASREDKVRPVSTNVVYEIISGEEYATIDTKGKLKGIATGEVVVRAYAEAGTEDAYADVTINVCIPITRIRLNKTRATVSLEDGELQLSADITPVENTDTLAWTSANEGIATVDENGLVTVHTKGRVKITVKSGSGKSATCTVTVTE